MFNWLFNIITITPVEFSNRCFYIGLFKLRCFYITLKLMGVFFLINFFLNMDAISIERIKTAHPHLRDELQKIYTEANNKLAKARLRFAYVLRTFDEQTKLFNQRPKVTNAKAGQSFHNYGLAVDIVLLIDKDKNGTFETATWDTKADWDADKIADWLEVVQVFKKYGWEWGGEFKSFKDLPHFQKTFGKTWQQLKALHDAKKVDKDGYVII